MRKLRAFSLLELVTVMAIVATMLGLGTYVLIQLRYRTEVRTAVSELVDLFNSTRNSARNGELSGRPTGATGSGAVVGLAAETDYYALVFSNNRYYKLSCEEGTTAGLLLCGRFSADQPGDLSAVAEFAPANANCGAFIFSLGSGRLRFAEVLSNALVVGEPDRGGGTLNNPDSQVVTDAGIGQPSGSFSVRVNNTASCQIVAKHKNFADITFTLEAKQGNSRLAILSL